MTENTKLNIAFGRQTFPEDVRAVWGARLIWPNDLVANRQDLDARDDEAKAELVAWLDGNPAGTGAIKGMRANLTAPYSLGLSSDMPFEEEAVIFEDDKGKIVGSAQGSYGHLYVCGWLKEHTA